MAQTFNTNKIYSMIRQVSLVAPAVGIAIRSDRTPPQKINDLIAIYTGYDPALRNFNFARLVEGWGGYVAANVVTRGVPTINKLVRSFI